MDCLFCKIIKKEIPSKSIYEDEFVIVIMDAFPEVDGHLLVIPKVHYEDIYSLDDKILLHINKVAKDINKMLLKKLNINASMFAVNYGDRQQIKHFHLHILPNYSKNEGKENIDTVYQKLIKND